MTRHDNTIIIYLSTLLNAAVGLMLIFESSDAALDVFYLVSVVMVLVSWVLVQVIFVRSAMRSRSATTEQGITRQQVQQEGLIARLAPFKTMPRLPIETTSSPSGRSTPNNSARQSRFPSGRRWSGLIRMHTPYDCNRGSLSAPSAPAPSEGRV